MKEFATEKGKQVSLDDVKAFALAIPHVSWKVERIRRLSSALATEEGAGISNSNSAKVSAYFHKQTLLVRLADAIISPFQPSYTGKQTSDQEEDLDNGAYPAGRRVQDDARAFLLASGLLHRSRQGGLL